jgi:hypothetical protein
LHDGIQPIHPITGGIDADNRRPTAPHTAGAPNTDPVSIDSAIGAYEALLGALSYVVVHLT